MVHLRSVVLWLGIVALLEGVFALGLAAVFSREAGLTEMGAEAASLGAALIPAGVAGLVAWVILSALTAHRRAAAEASLRSTPHAH
jgi:uncharacterized membrane protein YvlD (DUF360 family)